MGLSRKELGEVLIHPLGDTTMLATTKLGQLSAIAFGVLPDLVQTLANVQAKLRQVLLILKMLVHPDIAVVIRQPARAMTPVVGDIKGFVALGG